MSNVQRISAVTAACLAFALTGCTGFKQAMGAGKQGPDETAISTRAPLVVPATFDLKPPQPGAPRPQDADTAAAAERVLGGGTAKAAPASEGEMALLTATGATKADPTIRQELRNEAREAGKRKSYADSVLFWRGAKVETGTPLDPNEEATRVRTMRPISDNKPVAAPVIEKAPDPPAPAEAAADAKEAEQKSEKDDDSGGWFDWF